MRLRFVPLLLVAIVALAVTPFATSKPAAQQKTIVLVTAKDTFRFTLSKRTVPHGVVVFKVTNKGKLQHDFWISGKKTKKLNAGQSATLTITLGKGKKPYKCTLPGHAAAGMKGVLTVT